MSLSKTTLKWQNSVHVVVEWLLKAKKSNILQLARIRKSKEYNNASKSERVNILDWYLRHCP